jgi:hypothetical protein
MADSIQHARWCVEHEFHEDGSSWRCSRVLYRNEHLGGVLVEVTWSPEGGTRLNLFADVDGGISGAEAYAIATALIVGAEMLKEQPA